MEGFWGSGWALKAECVLHGGSPCRVGGVSEVSKRREGGLLGHAETDWAIQEGAC